MSYEFVNAAPVKSTSTGRPAGPNPFTDVIKEIALATDDKGVPLAKSFVETHEAGDDVRKKVIARIKRQLSEAGEANDPKVTVNSRMEPVKVEVKGKPTDSPTETQVTFWTVKRQVRPRKPKVEATAPATASTEQSNAVAAPANTSA